MPGWVETACAEYQKRLPPALKLQLRELPLAPRGKASAPADAIRRESEALLAACPVNAQLVALDVTGKLLDTPALAEHLAHWQAAGRDLAFAIGGPDGFHPMVRERADFRWSLSPLTLPHPLARVLLFEQIYRAHTILTKHPYHK